MHVCKCVSRTSHSLDSTAVQALFPCSEANGLILSDHRGLYDFQYRHFLSGNVRPCQERNAQQIRHLTSYDVINNVWMHYNGCKNCRIVYISYTIILEQASGLKFDSYLLHVPGFIVHNLSVNSIPKKCLSFCIELVFHFELTSQTGFILVYSIDIQSNQFLMNFHSEMSYYGGKLLQRAFHVEFYFNQSIDQHLKLPAFSIM